MSTTRRRGAAVAVAALGVLLSGTLAGCSVSKDDNSGKGDPTPAAEPTPTPTPTQTQEASETPTPTPTSTSQATSTGSPDPQGSLLTAAELPPLNASSPWAEKATTGAGTSSFGACQKFDVLSIGAMSAVERRFTSSAPGDTAGQQVAEFPDAQNTVRASKVFESWHNTCKGQVKGKNVKVGAITSAPVAKGKGWWYVVSWNRGGHGHFHSFGLVYNRNRMSLLKMDHGGQDHDYPPGQDPMELAVKAASAKM
jgi:hypothetical protein